MISDHIPIVIVVKVQFSHKVPFKNSRPRLFTKYVNQDLFHNFIESFVVNCHTDILNDSKNMNYGIME